MLLPKIVLPTELSIKQLDNRDVLVQVKDILPWQRADLNCIPKLWNCIFDRMFSNVLSKALRKLLEYEAGSTI